MGLQDVAVESDPPHVSLARSGLAVATPVYSVSVVAKDHRGMTEDELGFWVGIAKAKSVPLTLVVGEKACFHQPLDLCISNCNFRLTVSDQGAANSLSDAGDVVILMIPMTPYDVALLSNCARRL
jgi:hypothetical protein